MTFDKFSKVMLKVLTFSAATNNNQLLDRVIAKLKNKNITLNVLEQYMKDLELFSSGDEDQPLFWAVRCENPHAVKLFLENGMNLHKFSVEETLLHLAARLDNLEVVRLLIENGANLESQDTLEYTPLQVAIGHEKWNVVKMLVDEYKANTDYLSPDQKKKI